MSCWGFDPNPSTKLKGARLSPCGNFLARQGHPERTESTLAERTFFNYAHSQAQICILALPPPLQANITPEWATTHEERGKRG